MICLCVAVYYCYPQWYYCWEHKPTYSQSCCTKKRKFVIAILAFLPHDAMAAWHMQSLCVHLSITSEYCIETTGPIKLVFAIDASFHLSHTEIWVSAKIMVLPSGNLSKTLDLENFATASRSRCQQNSPSSSSTVELVDNTYTTIDESWLFTASRSTVTL